MTIRERMSDLAKSYLGCGFASEKDRYLDLVMPTPPETEPMRTGMGHASGCALTVRGFWRILGLKHELLSKPYRIGMAVADVITIAKERGAWVPCPSVSDSNPIVMPGVGDTVYIGGADGTYEHVFTVTGTNGLMVYLIEGGRVDAHGAQIILGAQVSWRPASGHWHHGTRRVNGWVDITKLGIPENVEPVKTIPSPPPEPDPEADPPATMPSAAIVPHIPGYAAGIGALILAIAQVLPHC